MEQVSIFPLLRRVKFLLFGLAIVVAGCSLEKESAVNRNLQNLTAHYNILFNAKEILRLKQESYATSFIDNYNEILSVYQDTVAGIGSPDKDLDAAIAKANKIISIKEQSHYLGDAYLILGKAYFLEGNYFNAIEYFSYIMRSFPNRTDLTQDALCWKARSLIYLNQLPDAKIAIDTAVKNINPKKSITADVYATNLQYDINTSNYTDAEVVAKKAIEYSNTKIQRLRWTFILSQIQELNNENDAALANYTTISKSNASFEMAFNASLNRIRMQQSRNGVKETRIQDLLSLLKNPNNKEFKDQIYYQVAQLYFLNKDIDNAIKYYKLSVHYSIKNQNQKGLSYLRLAQINFKQKADYISAKKYYDSTLTSLPTNYPGYQEIQKIGNNLQLLADRMQIITREDTLQALARMDEKTRLKIIDKMVSDRILQQQAAINSSIANSNSSDVGPGAGGTTIGNSFYFYNTNAVGQGYGDFKKRWGNRKLEDNWRRSDRSGSDITNSNSTNIQGGDPDAPVTATSGSGKNSSTAANYRQELITGLPLTPQLLAQSNIKIYNAYIDVANFYRDVLNDKGEAIAEYELLLHRFPNDPNLASIYYNLYRLYSDIDPAKSNQYKNKLLKDYPETPFAKVITDPDYLKKLDDRDLEFTQAYNRIFDLYSAKKYSDVITSVPQVLKQHPGNKFTAQLLYLKTLSEGHNERLIPFRDSLQQIAMRFPTDRLITPLINQHLAYISTNNAELMNRDTVLTNRDPHEIPFTLDPALKEQTNLRRAVKYDFNQPKPQAVAQVTKMAVAPPQVTVQHDSVKQTVKAVDFVHSIFSMRDTTHYYFVINVSTGTTNLSSSRFGIGQFDRVNYAGKAIRHELKRLGPDDQLIYVGRFFNLADAKTYAKNIIPLLPDIMKVPTDKYSFFIITKENLDKLADKKTLDSYVDYYQTNY